MSNPSVESYIFPDVYTKFTEISIVSLSVTIEPLFCYNKQDVLKDVSVDGFVLYLTEPFPLK